MSEFCPLKNYLLKVICVTWVWLTLYQLAWNLTLGSCIYYLSLNGKLPPKLSSWKREPCLISVSEAQESQRSLLGWFCPRVFQETMLQTLSETMVISWLNWGRICFYTLLYSYWKTPGDSLPGLLKFTSFQRCLVTWQLASSRGGDPRGNEREHTRRKPRSSYNLVMGHPHHVCCILFISSPQGRNIRTSLPGGRNHCGST